MQSEVMKIFSSVALQSLSTDDLCVFICVCEHLVICGTFSTVLLGGATDRSPFTAFLFIQVN